MACTNLSSRRLLPLFLAMTMLLACNLLAGGTQEAKPTATAQEIRRSAAEVLQAAASEALGGADLITWTGTGADLLAEGSGIEEAFASLGVEASAVELSTVASLPEAVTPFAAMAITFAGRDWAAELARRVEASADTPGDVKWEEIIIAGRTVFQASAVDDPSLSPVFYLAAGPTLVAVQAEANVAAAAMEHREWIDIESGGGGSVPYPPGPLLPGRISIFFVGLSTYPPPCVGEVPGRVQIQVKFLDQYVLPSPLNSVVVFTSLQEHNTATFVSGPILTLPYAAVRYGSGGSEQVLVQATTALGEAGSETYLLTVEHCLQGTWQDGERVVRILRPNRRESITADIISGTSCGEEGGVAFTGVLSRDRLTGSDLKVCNPERCVEAGFLPLSTTVPYTGVVADDSMSIAIDWTGAFYTWEEDAQGNLLSCNQTSTEDHSFTVTRLTFGD